MLLLTLPALAMVGFASVLSLRGTKRDLGAPYTITESRLVVGFNSLSDGHKQMASYHCPGLNLQNCVMHEIEVESRRASWFENWIYGNNDSRADLEVTSCVDVKSGLDLLTVSAIKINGVGGTAVSHAIDFYDLRSLKKAKGAIEFRALLRWTRDGQEFSRNLTKKILPANLRQGI